MKESNKYGGKKAPTVNSQGRGGVHYIAINMFVQITCMIQE